MLVALQVASAQLTPRIIATTLLRDNTIRFTVGLFVFTLLLAVGTNARLPRQRRSGGGDLAGVLAATSDPSAGTAASEDFHDPWSPTT